MNGQPATHLKIVAGPLGSQALLVLGGLCGIQIYFHVCGVVHYVRLARLRPLFFGTSVTTTRTHSSSKPNWDSSQFGALVYLIWDSRQFGAPVYLTGDSSQLGYVMQVHKLSSMHYTILYAMLISSCIFP